MNIMYLSWRCLLYVYSCLKHLLKWPNNLSQWPTKFVVGLTFVRPKEIFCNPHCAVWLVICNPQAQVCLAIDVRAARNWNVPLWRTTGMWNSNNANVNSCSVWTMTTDCSTILRCFVWESGIQAFSIGRIKYMYNLELKPIWLNWCEL